MLTNFSFTDLFISTEKIDNSNYKLRISPTSYPLAKVRVFVSKNGSDFLIDSKAESGFNRFNIPSNFKHYFA